MSASLARAIREGDAIIHRVTIDQRKHQRENDHQSALPQSHHASGDRSACSAWRCGAGITSSTRTCRWRGWMRGFTASLTNSADAGGDVYYVSACATGRITRLLVADVSGHGANVRDTAISLRDLMRQYVNHIDQTRFVRLDEQKVRADVGGKLVRDGGGDNVLRADELSHALQRRPSFATALSTSKKRWTLLSDRVEHDSDKITNIPLGIEARSITSNSA